MERKSWCAVSAGTCASAASLFGKLAGSPILVDLFLLRIVCVALMVLCNAGVWTLFVKALQASKSSLTPTVISTASNYLISMIAGFLVFNETTSLLRWSGLAFILFGIVLIIRDEQFDYKHYKQNKTKKTDE